MSSLPSVSDAIRSNNFDFLSDGDDAIRPCTISIYERSILETDSTDLPIVHWTVCFEWEDGYTASYEANDDKGHLIPRWFKGTPQEIYPNHCWTVHKKCQVVSSENRLTTSWERRRGDYDAFFELW